VILTKRKQSYVSLDDRGWRGVIHPHATDLLGRLSAGPISSNPDAVLVRDRDAAKTYRLPWHRTTVFVKHMTCLKSAPGLWRTAVEWTKWRFRPSRAIWSWRMSRRVRDAGVATYRVVLAARRKAGWSQVEDLLITEALAGRPLADALAEADAPRRGALLAALGNTLGRLHNAGILHGDLAPGNLFVLNGSTTVALIDHDRTRYWLGFCPVAWRVRNLVPLIYRLRMGLPWRDVRIVLDRYFSTVGVRLNVRRARLALIRQCRRSIAKFHRRPRRKTPAFQVRMNQSRRTAINPPT